jgi:hypothetical protein
MFRPWPTPHNATVLAAISLLLACSNAGTDQLTETNDTSGSSNSGTTQSSNSDPSTNTTTPTTGDLSGPGSTTGGPTGETDTSITSQGDTTDSPSSSTSTGTTGTGDTSTGTGGSTGTSTGEPGSSSSTGEPGPSCLDGQLNQDETDIDCGGAVCPTCEDDLACLVDADCTSNECVNGICTAPTCDDKAQNGAETDIDCGGPDCLPCADELACLEAADCVSNVCTNNLCAAPSCVDLAQNAAETDIDCGGPDCMTCADGGKCVANTDCTSGVCTVDTCTGASCFDGLKNGAEVEIDCGGPACAPCKLQTLILNEVDYDQAGTDAAEFIEIFNNTGAPVSLNGLEVRLVNGAMADLKVYTTIKLGNGMLNQGQYLVIGPAGLVLPPEALFVPFAGLTNQMQNGDPDGLALVDVPNKLVLDVFSYGGAITNAILGAPFPVTSLVEGEVFPANKKDNSDPSRSLARIPSGNDKNNAATDWASTVNVTPGAANKP